MRKIKKSTALEAYDASLDNVNFAAELTREGEDKMTNFELASISLNMGIAQALQSIAASLIMKEEEEEANGKHREEGVTQ